MIQTKNVAIALSRKRCLSYKRRRSLIKRIYPDMLKDYEFEVDFFEPDSGLKFSGNIANYIDRLVYFCGAHEKYMLTFLQQYVASLRKSGTSNITYVDVGANAGNHVVFMARLVDSIYAFEPFERVRNQLQHNLGINNISNVKLFDFGLSDANKTEPFYAAPDSNLGAASFQKDHAHDSYYLGDLQLRNGDEVLSEEKANISILKIDVEGYEKYVMEGLQASVEKDRPLIIMELTETTRGTLGDEKSFHALFPKDYKFYYFSKGSNDSGRYKLAPYDYGLTPKIEDVIACPEELLTAMPNLQA